MLQEAQQSRDEAQARCCRNLKSILRSYDERFKSAGARLQALSPLSVLNRGYSMVLGKDGCAVKSAQEVNEGDNVTIRFSEGSAQATITKVTP